MSRATTTIDGTVIRRKLREANLPGGVEKVCCGGRISFSRDYETQLKRLGMHGNFRITERGVLVTYVSIP